MLSKRAKVKFASTVALIGVFFTFTQCVQELEVEKMENIDASVTMPDDDNHNFGDDSDSDTLDNSFSGEFSEEGATEVARSISSVGIKNFEQIHISMAVVTGINPDDETAIKSAFDKLTSQMPNQNDVKQFNSSIQFAIFKLASEYCSVMVDKPAYSSQVFTNFNVNQRADQALNSQGKVNLVNNLINRLWGIGVQPAASVESTRAELLELVDSLLEGERMDSADTTKDVAKGVCSALLPTPPITML